MEIKELDGVRKAADEICDKADDGLWKSIQKIPSEEMRLAISEAFRQDRDNLLKMVYSTLAKAQSFVGKVDRFKPVKRTFADGRTGWVAWDSQNNRYSTLVCHGIYKTKKDCQFYINYFGVHGYYK